MRNVRMTIWVVVVVCLYCFNLPKAKGELVFDDGEHHIVDYVRPDTISVQYEPFFHVATTVDFVEGASATGLRVWNNCSVNILGGTITHEARFDDDSVVTISGGNINSLDINDNADVDISGGIFNSTYSIYLGLSGNHTGDINISGGQFDGIVYGNGYGTFAISGGEFNDIVSFTYSTQGTITGGTFLGDEIHIGDSARVTIHGSDFEVNGVPISYGTVYSGSREGQLTGILADGTGLNIPLRNTQNASLTFVLIPEPTTLLLLGLGGLMMRRKR